MHFENRQVSDLRFATMLSIVITALGTRGDVQPLALLSWQILHDCIDQCVDVTFITHAAHQVWLENLLCSTAVQLLYIDSRPAAVWQHDSGEAAAVGATCSRHAAENSAEPHHANCSRTVSMSQEVEIRQQLLQHCCTALGCDWPSHPHQQNNTIQQQQQQLQQRTEPEQQINHGSEQHQQPCTPEQQYTDQQQQQQQQRRQRCIIFNLFALESYHIAEALQVPCLVAQPYLIPYALPSSFQRRLGRAAPSLAQRLQQGSDGQQSVSWRDVSHWMWPLFTQRWGDWRQEVLHLQPLPLTQAVQEGWQGCTYRQASSSSSTGQNCGDQAAADGVQQLPASVPVLYGLSPHVVNRPGYWPQSVQLTGFWLVSEVHSQPAWWQQQQQQQHNVHQQLQQQLHHMQQQQQQSEVQQQQHPEEQPFAASHNQPCHMQQQPQLQQQQQGTCQLPAALQLFLTCCSLSTTQPQERTQLGHRNASTPAELTASAHHTDLTVLTHQPAAPVRPQPCRGMLLVDFGSMGCLGLLRDAMLLLQVVLEALKLLQWRGVLMTGGWQPLAEAYSTLGPQSQQQLFLQQEPVACHHLLLSQVDAVLHHGGSGTTAAALAAGVPQLICPLQFDQFYWAERVTHLGCSPEAALSLDKLLPSAGIGSSSTEDSAEAAPADRLTQQAVHTFGRSMQHLRDMQTRNIQQQQYMAKAAPEPTESAPPLAAAAAATTGGKHSASQSQLLTTQQAEGGDAAANALLTPPLAAATGAATAPGQHGMPQSHLQTPQHTEDAKAAAATPAAIKAAGAYLAYQVIAARRVDVVEACRRMKEELAPHSGLRTAATFVLQYCQSLLKGQQAAPGL